MQRTTDTGESTPSWHVHRTAPLAEEHHRRMNQRTRTPAKRWCSIYDREPEPRKSKKYAELNETCTVTSVGMVVSDGPTLDEEL